MSEEKMVGIKDMHPMQVEALMDFCCYTLELAHNMAEIIGDPEVASEAVNLVESMTEIFGANAIILQTSHGWSDLGRGLDSLEAVLKPRKAVGRAAKPEPGEPKEQGPASEK